MNNVWFSGSLGNLWLFSHPVGTWASGTCLIFQIQTLVFLIWGEQYFLLLLGHRKSFGCTCVISSICQGSSLWLTLRGEEWESWEKQRLERNLPVAGRVETLNSPTPGVSIHTYTHTGWPSNRPGATNTIIKWIRILPPPSILLFLLVLPVFLSVYLPVCHQFICCQFAH